MEILSLVKQIWRSKRQLQLVHRQASWKQDLSVTEHNSQCSPTSVPNSDRLCSKSQGSIKKMLLHQFRPFLRKSFLNSWWKSNVKPSSSFQAPGSVCITSTHLLHEGRAKERRWPDQRQKRGKAGTSGGSLLPPASEARKWSCPSQIIYSDKTSPR